MLGCAVMEGWHDVHGSASHPQAYALTQTGAACRPRQNLLAYIEHQARSAVQLACVDYMGVPDLYRSTWSGSINLQYAPVRQW